MYTILEQENKNLFQKTLDDLKTQIKFVGTFGFGITGLYETVQELLHGKYPTLSEHEIILIFLAALSYFSINVIDDVKKLNKIIQEKGLKKYLTQTVETLKDFENLAIEIGKKTGHTISSLAELVGYIYLLIPILETVQRLVAKEGFDIVTLGIYLKSILTSVGIFYTKNIFDKLIGRLKRDIPKDGKDVIKEHTERKDELRRVLDKYEKDYKRVSPELIIDLAIEDPSSEYDYLDWMVDQVRMGFFLGVDLKYVSKLINRFHLHKEILTKGRLLRMLDRFKMLFPGPWVWNNDEIFAQILEDPSNINNYPGYGQVEQILQMIDFSTGSSQPDLQVEQLEYLQKKGEQSTRKVVSDILKIIKEPDSDEEFYHLPDYFSGIDGDMYEFGELEFNVYVNIVNYDSLIEPFIVDAEMGGDYDDEIYVTITIGPNFSTTDYEDIQMVLNDYIRHEVEHVIDATEGGDIESPDNLSPYDYYMQPHEVRAQKAGFNRKAKLEKKPVEDIIYDYLEYRQKIDKLSDEEKSNLTKTLSEDKEQPGLSPELTYGDTILVVDIDREREDGKTTYTTPGEQMRPEQYVPYTVVDKETNGSHGKLKAKWPFRYTLVPEGQVDEYEKSLDRGWGNYGGYEKLLYPWIYEWIFANTPKANKVDRKTISEHGADTSWANDDDKVTLEDILELTKDIPIISYPTKELAKLPSLKKIVLGWDPKEIERISQVDVSRQYPILVMVNEYNELQWILDGNHRAQQAVMNDIPTIPAKLIKPSDLDERSIKMFYPEGIPGTNQTISEHQETKVSPELEVDDVIRVIEVEGDDYEWKGQTKRPETFAVYRVLGKGGFAKFDGARRHYDLIKLPVSKETRHRIYTIYEQDTWIYAEPPQAITEHKDKRYNQPLEDGDVIQLIHMDDPWSPIPPLTRGIVVGFEKVPSGEPKILVRWVIDAENDEFRNLPMIPEIDVWKKIEKMEDLIVVD